jgi:prepilin-type N-terminal cleavage/methylation domain-containing protein
VSLPHAPRGGFSADRRATARRPLRSDAARSEAGFSLTELLVTVAIVGIVLSMTVVIVTTFIIQAANTERIGLASETAQNAMAQVDQYVRSAISPANVQSAAAASGSSSSCWGSTSPSPAGGVPLSQGQSQSLAVISAHDFDVWFCGFKSGDAKPHVYEITINTNLCANNDAAGGYCTLQVIDHGYNCVPGAGSGLGGSDTVTCSGATNSPTGNAVLSIPNVWCDQFCQGSNPTNPPNTTGYTETYSVNGGSSVNQTIAVACIDQPVAVRPNPTCTGNTPPLFQYFLGTASGSGAQGGQCFQSATCNQVPINPQCSGSSCVLPASVCTTNCNSPLDLSASAVPSLPVPAPALNLLLGIQLVVVHLTVGAPASALQTLSNGNPGATLSNQVFLVNQLNKGYQSCSYDQALASLANPDSNWQMGDTGGAPGNAPVADSSGFANLGQVQGNVNGAGGVQEGQTSSPGLLACNPSAKFMTFPGTGGNYIQTTDQFCGSSEVVGGVNTICPTPNTGPQSFTVIAWFKTPSGTTNEGVMGFANTQTVGATESDRLLSIDAQGDLDWTVCSGCTAGSGTPSVAHSGRPVNDGNWHMAVATVAPSTNTVPLEPGGGGQYVYVDGDLVGSNSAQYGWNYAGFWQIGDDPSAVLNPFTGSIGRVTIIPQVLSPQQVTQLYNDSGTVVSCSTGTVSGAQPLAFYPFRSDDVASFNGGNAVVHDHAPWQSGVKTQTYDATEVHPLAPVSMGVPAPPPLANGGAPSLCNPQQNALPLNVSSNHQTYIDLGYPPGGSPGTQGGGNVFTPSWPSSNTDQLTVEAWVNVANYTAGQNVRVVADDRSQCTNHGFELVINNGGGGGYFSVGNGIQNPSGCDGFGQDRAPNFTDNAHDGNASWTATGGTCTPSGAGVQVVNVPIICPDGSGGGWYFVVGTYDGSFVRAYVDGTEVAMVPYTQPIATPSASTCGATMDVDIGFEPQNCIGYLNGWVANAAVYTTALTGAQIQAQYLAGSQP